MTAFEQNSDRVECCQCKGQKRVEAKDISGHNQYVSCPRCNRAGTVLVDKPCSECGGNPSVKVLVYQNEEHKLSCCRCSGTGVEPRDKRMERLMREAEHHYRLLGENWVADYSAGCALRRSTTITLSDLVGAIKETSTPHPVAAFTGWCVADWQMREDGQG